jgi:uncharacterized protein (DUF58 family)
VIIPTRAAALAAAAGMPVALVVAVVLPARWYVALAWPAAVLVLVIVDALLAPRRGQATLSLPASAPVGGVADARIEVRIEGGGRSAEVAVAADPLIETANDGRQWVPLVDGRGVAIVPLVTLRRGTARIARVWLRWRGPLGLVWRARSEAVDAELPILPDIRPVRERGALLFRRHALDGLIAQLERGEGTEFETLAEYRPGMDRRAIDWKQSARHVKLYAKQFRPERNNQVVLAIDASRQMSEPVAGVPRVDRAVSAALLLAWIALKLGDRVALEAFDERPRLRTGFVGGVRAFGMLQHRAAAIDYSGAESNYTFALADLAARLTRRSTVVLFTEFTDLVASDFLVRATTQLVAGHLLIVVVLADEELEAVLARPPEEAADVTRAVTAAGLLRDRLLVLTRLRHLGVHVVEAAHDRLGERLVATYADLKRRGLA